MTGISLCYNNGCTGISFHEYRRSPGQKYNWRCTDAGTNDESHFREEAIQFRNSQADPVISGQIMDLGTILLRFVAVFILFDAMNLIFSGTLKGAGDTQFILWTTAALSCIVMIIPVYLAVEVFDYGIYTAWVIVTIYIAALGLSFYLRYRYGRWKQMRIIEATPGLRGPFGSKPR